MRETEFIPTQQDRKNEKGSKFNRERVEKSSG
jgi:hypothetical protein